MYTPRRTSRHRRSWSKRLFIALAILLAIAAVILAWFMLVGWSLMIAFGIVHAQLDWAQHPGYWPSVQLGFAFGVIGSAFTASLLSAIYTARR